MINSNIPIVNIIALKKIVEKFKNKNINWVLTGSTSLAIQGVDVKAKDIDILTDVENADKIAELLKEYVIEPMNYKTSEHFKSYYGKFKISEVEVEVMADLEKKYNNKWIKSERPRIKLIKRFEDMTLPLLELQEECEAYILMGREDKANKILEALEKEKSSYRKSGAS
ncbi:MAG: nucleotidyltransferase domain-containing protein [Candidatus Woesearchaeota archaeon]